MVNLIFSYKVKVALFGDNYRTFATVGKLSEAKTFAAMWEKNGHKTKIVHTYR